MQRFFLFDVVTPNTRQFLEGSKVQCDLELGGARTFLELSLLRYGVRTGTYIRNITGPGKHKKLLARFFESNSLVARYRIYSSYVAYNN